MEKGATVLVDTGHPDINFGEYKPLTSGKKWTFEGHPTIYEGAYNRMVARLFMWKLGMSEIPYYNVGHHPYDVPLNERKYEINKIQEKHHNVYLLSIHGNAYIENKADGVRFYTSKGETDSDKIGVKYAKSIKKEASEFIKVDNFERDKNFSILLCGPPALLIELGFMTSFKDYIAMTNLERLDDMTDGMLNAAKFIYENGI